MGERSVRPPDAPPRPHGVRVAAVDQPRWIALVEEDFHVACVRSPESR
ncbi:hypothetical protein A6P39_003870 [Streptomyces sp. FXJ1.172]|nr:hypothetical protein [Streptomyces sp. FXJ1.172]WEO93246.1 hypothetical protein A6P39_003870 [Streptomyces sp. FXJ1.172]